MKIPKFNLYDDTRYKFFLNSSYNCCCPDLPKITVVVINYIIFYFI